MKSVYVLDACALIAFFNDENGADIVEQILDKGMSEKAIIFMHKINVFEIYYGILRENGSKAAEMIQKTISELPITIVDNIGEDLFVEAAKLKAKYKISLGDSFALGLSKIKKAKLTTSDHHEFDVIDKNKELSFEWIR